MGKSPYFTETISYEFEYGGDNLRIHSDAAVHEQSALSKMFGRLDGITVVRFVEWS